MKAFSPQVAVIFHLSMFKGSFYFSFKTHTQFWHKTYDSAFYSTNPIKTDDSAISYNGILLWYSTKHALGWLERGFKLIRQKQHCPNSEHMLFCNK